jgi:hypothetical protein
MSVQAAGITVTINGATVYARSASANSTQSTEPIKVLGYALAQGQAPSGPTETTVNVEYYIQDGDPVYSLAEEIIGDPTSHTGVDINIGSATIKKAFLTSHSVTAEPQGLVTASASFVSFEQDNNLTIGTSDPETAPGSLPFAHGQGSTAGGASQSSGFTYESNFEWEPILLMGAKGVPLEGEPCIFNGGTQTLNIREIGGGGTVSYCLTDNSAEATVAASCGGANQAYSVNGQVTSAEINAEVGGFAEGGITITKQL